MEIDWRKVMVLKSLAKGKGKLEIGNWRFSRTETNLHIA